MKSAQREPAHTNSLGLTLVIIAVVAWSSAGLFTSILTVDTATVLFWRSLYGAIGTVIVIAFFPHTGGIAAFNRLTKAGVIYAAVTAFSMLMFISALRNTSVAHVAVITAAIPFFAAGAGWLFLKEPPGGSALVASLVALVGVALMAGISSDGALLGDGLALLMAICMAAMILIARRNPTIPALHATFLATVFTALATLPFANLTQVPVFDMGILVIFGLVNQVLGFGLFALGSRLIPPAQTALVATLEAPLAPFWVWLILSETPHAATVVGGALVLAAVLTHLTVSQR